MLVLLTQVSKFFLIIARFEVDSNECGLDCQNVCVVEVLHRNLPFPSFNVHTILLRQASDLDS